MTGRHGTNTPDFDNSVMSHFDDGNDGGQQANQQQQIDNTQTDDDNRQPTQPPQNNQQQPGADDNIDSIIARTDGTPPPKKEEQKPNQQQQQQQQPQNKKLLDDDGREVPSNARHHFFARKKAEQTATKLTTENASLKGQLTAFQTLHTQMQQSGLSAQEQAVAIDLGRKLKTNPVETVKEILTALKASGHNIDGAIGVNTIDTASIASLIDAKLKPFTDNIASQREREEHEAAIAEDVQSFFDENQEAVIHSNELNALLQRFPTWSLDKAWSQLQVSAVRAGLDLSKPLMPQYAARRGNTQNRPVNGGPVVQMTGGRGGGTQQGAHQQPQKSFGHNARSQDIVKHAMASAGLDVSRIG